MSRVKFVGVRSTETQLGTAAAISGLALDLAEARLLSTSLVTFSCVQGTGLRSNSRFSFEPTVARVFMTGGLDADRPELYVSFTFRGGDSCGGCETLDSGP